MPAGRVVARVDRLRQEPLLVVRPELAHLGIGLDGRVDQLAALAQRGQRADGDTAEQRVRNRKLRQAISIAVDWEEYSKVFPKKAGDTVGGVFEVVVHGVPPGLGTFAHWDRRLDSQLAAALMGIQAIKGVEVGDGFETARRRGSVAHDEIERDSNGIVRRLTDRAGGIEGGMSNGEVLRVRAAMKPISTVPRALSTIDVATGDAAKAHHQRSDVCAVPAAGVVAEAMVALVVANSVLEKFGGDSVAETKRNLESYLANIPATLKSFDA